MNTAAVTIPWGAVVEGCPPSQAKALPLVVSNHCALRGERESLQADVRGLAEDLSRGPSGALAIGRRSTLTTLVELLFSNGEEGAVATLTSDGTSRVVLQAISSSWPAFETHDPELDLDSLVRAYVLRYARLDADVRALVPAIPGDDGGDGDPSDRMQFIRPENWGFRTAGKSPGWGSRLEPTGRHVANRYCSTMNVVVPPHRSEFDEPTPDRGDPFDCLSLLNHARARLETQLCAATIQPQAEPLCCWSALALGRCRLFGVKVDEAQDFTLGPVTFLHAAGHLLGRLRHLVQIGTLADQIVNTGRAYAQRNFALGLLEARTDVHAAHLALDEAYAAALYDGSPEVPAMSRRLTQVRRLINLFDGNLKKNLPLLRLAASTYLLDNWRRLLAPAYRDCPPWWLDGCIG